MRGWYMHVTNCEAHALSFYQHSNLIEPRGILNFDMSIQVQLNCNVCVYCMHVCRTLKVV